MKKNSLIVAVALLCLAVLCGCSKPTVTEISIAPIDIPEVSEVFENRNLELFPLVDAEYDSIEVYRQEVLKRLDDNETSFMHQHEIDAIEELYSNKIKEVNGIYFAITDSKYYYPVVFRDSLDNIVVWYTTNDGNTIFEEFNDHSHSGLHSGSVCGSAHRPSNANTDETLIEGNYAFETTYNPETGEVTKYQFGTIVS